jgi:4-hydroxybenzoate polyprenyltransferase
MTSDNGITPDALPDHWIERAPHTLQPYLHLMRLDRPIGIWLLLIPCLWGVALSSLAIQRALPNLWHLFLFALGAIVMRGAGCIWNDYIDRDFDRRVKRTKARPLAAGHISVREALLLMTTLAMMGLVILLQFNGFTIFFGLLSTGLIGIYPYVKRVSNFPQLILGLAFSWGALLGWSAELNSLSFAPIMLYAAAIAWAVGYDTVYAMQDIEDDALVGVGSTPRFFGKNAKLFVAACYLICALFMASAFKLAQTGFAAYAGLLIFAFLLGQQVYQLEGENSVSALKAFQANKLAGLVLFASLIADGLLRFYLSFEL